jgi:hypothetical protein
MGPVELLIVKFPGNEFTGELAPALGELIDTGTIRVIDLVFVTKDADGSMDAIELADLDPAVAERFSGVVEEFDGLFSDEDLDELAGLIEDDSSAAILLFENQWAERFEGAMRNANAEVLFNERIPRAVIDSVLADSES